MSLRYTPVGDIPTIVDRCRRGFQNNLLRTADQRRSVLRQILSMVQSNEKLFCDACQTDLRRPSFETTLSEIFMVINDAITALDNLEDWMGPTHVHKEGIMKLEECYTQPDPKGVVLIIGAWNYPFQLTLVGAIGAIAAGNTVVMKPSEVSPTCARVLTELIERYVAKDVISIVNGAVAETTALLAERFDHIMYTGNDRVARIVMTAAAKHLTPVTLELGGKCPTIVDDTCGDLSVVAQRLVWGRVLNAGQTCIAPDYILVKESVKKDLIEALRTARTKFLGSDPKQCEHYSRIVNDFHYKRVRQLMDGGKAVVGGETDDATRFIAPTVLDDVDLDHALMKDEIFGPLLPLLTFRTKQEVIDFINKREKPLALYIFSKDSDFVDSILTMTSSGGATVNDTLMHVSVDTLPFGGVGNSGMGAYHGKHTFDTFSHTKSVMKRKLILEMTNDLRYPPYTDRNLGLLRFLLAKKREAYFSKRAVRGILAVAVVGVIVAVVLGTGYGLKKF